MIGGQSDLGPGGGYPGRLARHLGLRLHIDPPLVFRYRSPESAILRPLLPLHLPMSDLTGGEALCADTRRLPQVKQSRNNTNAVCKLLTIKDMQAPQRKVLEEKFC